MAARDRLKTRDESSRSLAEAPEALSVSRAYVRVVFRHQPACLSHKRGISR